MRNEKVEETSEGVLDILPRVRIVFTEYECYVIDEFVWTYEKGKRKNRKAAR